MSDTAFTPPERDNRDPTNSELLTMFACWVLSLACVLGLTAVFA